MYVVVMVYCELMMLISGNPGNCSRACFLQKGCVLFLPGIGDLLAWDYINLLPGYWLSTGVYGAVSQCC